MPDLPLSLSLSFFLLHVPKNTLILLCCVDSFGLQPAHHDSLMLRTDTNAHAGSTGIIYAIKSLCQQRCEECHCVWVFFHCIISILFIFKCQDMIGNYPHSFPEPKIILSTIVCFVKSTVQDQQIIPFMKLEPVNVKTWIKPVWVCITLWWITKPLNHLGRIFVYCFLVPSGFWMILFHRNKLWCNSVIIIINNNNKAWIHPKTWWMNKSIFLVGVDFLQCCHSWMRWNTALFCFLQRGSLTVGQRESDLRGKNSLTFSSKTWLCSELLSCVRV